MADGTVSPSAAPPAPPGRSGRPRLGIVISMFPELHETIILRELVALERRGVDFDVYSPQRPRDPITIDDAIRLSSERTVYSSPFTAATVAALARAALTRPAPSRSPPAGSSSTGTTARPNSPRTSPCCRCRCASASSAPRAG